MSRNFISEFAETLLERYAGDLSGIVVMFPSLRARTFFNEAVSNIVNHPVWQPSWATIDELMERSGLSMGELSLTLMTLELSGVIRQRPGSRYEKMI